MAFIKSLGASLAVCAALVPSTASALEAHSLSVGGIQREYLLETPGDVAGDTLVPLVLVLHGAGQTANAAVSMTAFDQLAKEAGFFAVFPDGTGPMFIHTWNAVHCCGPAMVEGADDITFITALIDALEAKYPIDPRRIYISGFSNGAMMTHRLAIALSDRVAAIGTVAGALFGDEPLPEHPVPAIIVNGAADPVIPSDGRNPVADGPPLEVWDESMLQPSAYQALFWAEANGCQPLPLIARTDAYRLERFTCPVGGAVEYYLVDDNRHAWPGDRVMLGSVSSDRFDATRMLWDFFRRQARALPEETEQGVPEEGDASEPVPLRF